MDKPNSKNEIMNKMKWIWDKGLIHILGTNVINKFLNFFTNVLVVRFLTQEAYGVFGYANNIISFFILLSGLGMINGVLQFASERVSDVERARIYKFGLKYGVTINAVLCAIILITSTMLPITIEESRLYISMLCFLPMTDYLFNHLCVILRCKKENRKYALLMNINTIMYSIGSIIGAYFGGIAGLIIMRYVAYGVTIIMGIILTRYKELFSLGEGKVNRTKMSEMAKYSFVSCLSTALSRLLYILDVFLIGVIIQDATVVAVYKVATLIPTALIFIPQGVMTFVYPYFVENNDNYLWLKEKIKNIYKILGIVNTMISLVLFIGAPFIIELLWGTEYLDSLIPFRILAVNYLIISTFRTPSGNILGMLRKVKFNLYVSVAASSLNIILDIVVILAWGAKGAATATLVVGIFTSLVSTVGLVYYINKIKE